MIGWEEEDSVTWWYHSSVVRNKVNYDVSTRFHRGEFASAIIKDTDSGVKYIARIVDYNMHVHQADTRGTYPVVIHSLRSYMIEIGHYNDGKLITTDNCSRNLIPNAQSVDGICNVELLDIKHGVTVPSFHLRNGVYYGEYGSLSKLSPDIKCFMAYEDSTIEISMHTRASNMSKVLICSMHVDGEQIGNAHVEPDNNIVTFYLHDSVHSENQEINILVESMGDHTLLRENSFSDEDRFMINLENGVVPWNLLENQLHILKNTPTEIFPPCRTLT